MKSAVSVAPGTAFNDQLAALLQLLLPPVLLNGRSRSRSQEGLGLPGQRAEAGTTAFGYDARDGAAIDLSRTLTRQETKAMT